MTTGSAAAIPRPGLLGRAATHIGALLDRSGINRAMVRGAGWSIGGTAAGAAASFIVQIVLARSLGATRYGVYSYLLAWVNVAVLLGKLEFDVAAIRFVSAYEGQHQDSLLQGFLRYAIRGVAGTATSIALIAAVAVWAYRAHLAAGMAEAIWAACALVPLSALLLFSGSALQGFRRVPQAQLPSQVLRPVLFTGGVLLAGSALGVGMSAAGAVALNAAATAVALGVSLVLLSRAIPAGVAAAAPAYDTARWMHAVRGFMLISAANLILSQQADVLVVGTLLSARDAGLYSAASQLSTLIGLGATAIIFVVLPAVSDLHARARVDELQRLVVRTVQTCAFVSVPVAVLLVVAGPLVLDAYGSAFAAGYPVLLILSIVQVAGAMMGGLAGYLLTMTGHEWQASRVIVGSALLNLALTIVLTPLLGIVGAALATLAAGFVKLGWLWWYVWHFIGVAVLPYVPAGRGRAVERVAELGFQFFADGSPEWEACNRSLAATGVRIPLPHHPEWARVRRGIKSRGVGLRGADGNWVAAFSVHVAPSRALPGFKLLRVERFGEGLPPSVWSTAVDALAALRREARVLRLSVEVFSSDGVRRARLGELLGEAGFAQQPSAKNWSTTLLLDLRRSEDEIFAAFSSSARRAIRAVAKGPLEVRPVDDPRLADRLDALLRETFARTGARYEARWNWARVIELTREVPRSTRLIGMFRTDRQGPDSLLGFAWGWWNGQSVSYFAGASTRPTDLRVWIVHPLFWDLITWGKTIGATTFDLGGVSGGTTESGDPVAGISDFKRLFSKDVVHIADDWILEPRWLPARVAAAVSAGTAWIQKIWR